MKYVKANLKFILWFQTTVKTILSYTDATKKDLNLFLHEATE